MAYRYNEKTGEFEDVPMSGTNNQKSRTKPPRQEPVVDSSSPTFAEKLLKFFAHAMVYIFLSMVLSGLVSVCSN